MIRAADWNKRFERERLRVSCSKAGFKFPERYSNIVLPLLVDYPFGRCTGLLWLALPEKADCREGEVNITQMHQHWVPASYLRAWYDPASLHLQDPYVWRFSKDGSEVRKKSPRNLFRESEMYTLTDENGQPNLTIERGLSRLESQFESLRRDKILYCEALTDEDKAALFLFVATAHFRTQRSQNHWREQ